MASANADDASAVADLRKFRKAANGPPVISAGHRRRRLRQPSSAHPHCRGWRWNTGNLMRLLDQGFRFRRGTPGSEMASSMSRPKPPSERGPMPTVEVTVRPRAPSGRPAKRRLHRADETGGIAGREQLLGIVAGATAAAQFLRGRELTSSAPSRVAAVPSRPPVALALVL